MVCWLACEVAWFVCVSDLWLCYVVCVWCFRCLCDVGFVFVVLRGGDGCGIVFGNGDDSGGFGVCRCAVSFGCFCCGYGLFWFWWGVVVQAVGDFCGCVFRLLVFSGCCLMV